MRRRVRRGGSSASGVGFGREVLLEDLRGILECILTIAFMSFVGKMVEVDIVRRGINEDLKGRIPSSSE